MAGDRRGAGEGLSRGRLQAAPHPAFSRWQASRRQPRSCVCGRSGTRPSPRVRSKTPRDRCRSAAPPHRSRLRRPERPTAPGRLLLGRCRRRQQAAVATTAALAFERQRLVEILEQYAPAAKAGLRVEHHAFQRLAVALGLVVVGAFDALLRAAALGQEELLHVLVALRRRAARNRRVRRRARRGRPPGSSPPGSTAAGSAARSGCRACRCPCRTRWSPPSRALPAHEAVLAGMAIRGAQPAVVERHRLAGFLEPAMQRLAGLHGGA